MATLFGIAAPLMLRYPYGTCKVIAARLPRPPGLLCLDTFGQWSK